MKNYHGEAFKSINLQPVKDLMYLEVIIWFLYMKETKIFFQNKCTN